MKKAGLKEKVLAYAKETYGSEPEYLWESDPESAVLRHRKKPGAKKAAKWYGLLMNVERERLKLSGEGSVEVLNVKCDVEMIGFLQMSEGFLPAYHMNKNHWITILLDGTVPFENITKLLDLSYDMTA